MKTILNVSQNLLKVFFLYIILPFIISSSMLTLIDIFNVVFARPLDIANVLMPYRFLNVLEPIVKLNYLDLFLLIEITFTFIRVAFQNKQIKNIRLNNCVYLANDRNYKKVINSSFGCYLRI